VAGFWNSHVHFTEPQWQDAARQPAEKLTAQLQRMLTAYGFTTVFDIASVLENTKELRRRVESGEVLGPKIFTAGEPLFPKNGVPIYVKTVISPELYERLKRTAEVETPEQAQAMVGDRIDRGADVIKLFTGSWVGGGNTVEMPLDVVKAATAEAHRLGKIVFAHPQTRAGLENACAGGVDILAHTAPTAGDWDSVLLARMKLANVALIPTLKLWHVEAIREGESPENTRHFINAGVEQLRAFITTGGRVLFGTDVGYIDDYSTAEEFDLMSQAGMTFQQILASLTTAPAARFGQSDHQGRVVRGYDADLVLLQGDPAGDTKAFANVKYTIRGGKIIYQH
jgi:imidazolonepropionase-like amidohydrolase